MLSVYMCWNQYLLACDETAEGTYALLPSAHPQSVLWCLSGTEARGSPAKQQAIMNSMVNG